MARPPRLTGQIPTVTADWQWHGEWPITTDAVLTGAWRLPKENKVVLLFANVSDSPVSSHLVWEPAEYGLAGTSFTMTTIAPDGTEEHAQTKPSQPEVELAARSVVALGNHTGQTPSDTVTRKGIS